MKNENGSVSQKVGNLTEFVGQTQCYWDSLWESCPDKQKQVTYKKRSFVDMVE